MHDICGLLQAPFCVHPKTGKVCVPIDPQRSSDFDPDGVPTIHDLVAAESGDRTEQVHFFIS
jgi:DNA primase catalytic subunit